MRSRLYLLVRPGQHPTALAAVLRWARVLVPSAILLSAPAAVPPVVDGEDAVVVSVDADDVASGPLALADAIARQGAAPKGGIEDRRRGATI